MNNSVPAGSSLAQSVSLPGRRSLRREVAVLRLISRSARRFSRSSIRSSTKAEQGPAALHMVGEIMVEMVAHRILDQPRGVGRGQPVLGLALELGIADEHREHDLGAGRSRPRPGCPSPSSAARPARRRRGCRGSARRAGPARGCRRRASGWCCNNKRRCPRPRAARPPPIRPSPGPFGKSCLPVKGAPVAVSRSPICSLQMVGEPAGELEHRLGRRLVGDQRRDRISSGSRRRRTDRPWSAPAGRAAPA